MKLSVVRGIPGSGKTTFSKRNFSCLILENDQFSCIDGEYQWSPSNVNKAISLVRQIAEMTLANGSDVCICNTFIKKRFIEGYKRLAEKYGAEFEVIRLCGKFKNVHNVPESVLKSMHDTFEDWDDEKLVDPSKNWFL